MKKKPNGQAPGSAPNPQDRERLTGFRISDRLIGQAGLRRVTHQQARDRGFGAKGADDLSGLVIPYTTAQGQVFTARLRRDNPERDENGKAKQKYLLLPDRARGLYWPPGARQRLQRDPKCKVVVVEAESSALAVMEYARRSGQDLIAVATGGCWAWRETVKVGKDREESRALADLEAFRGRQVCILFDSNVSVNENVKQGELELAAHLASDLQAEVRALRLPVEEDVNGPDDFLRKYKDPDFLRILRSPVEPWLAMVGESYEKYMAAKPPEFVIKQFLQSDGITFIGGLSGHGKSFLLLSIVRSLLTGEKLFGHFPVQQPAEKVIYLSPEITLGSFKLRAEAFRLRPFIKTGQLIIRTLSAYPMLLLTDPALLLSARGADIFLDTAVRFMEGDESSSTDNDKGLADGMFHLLQSGARTIIAAHHSPKSFEKAEYMSLENVLRGTGDIGAMLSTAWGVRMLNPVQTQVHVQNIKARDFEPIPPFQIAGRPFIDQGKGFQMAIVPGECGPLNEYVGKRIGRKRSPEKAERTATIEQALRQGKTEEQIAELVKESGIAPTTLAKEIRAARKRKC
jgi:AAA domain/Domain of unknown function (DUF3854)